MVALGIGASCAVAQEIADASHDKNAALFSAIKSGSTEAVAAALKGGANVNAQDEKGNTPLHKVVGAGASAVSIADLLLGSGANVQVKNADGETPLHVVASAADRQFELASRLIQAGADVNATTRDGVGVLEVAVRGNAPQVTELLVKAGADASRVRPLREALIFDAVSKNYPEVAAVLIHAGADVNAKDMHGHSPLHTAARTRGSGKVAELLIKSGADVNAKSQTGRSALHEAALFGNRDVAELLLKAGAESEALGYRKRTPLHDAAACGSSAAYFLDGELMVFHREPSPAKDALLKKLDALPEATAIIELLLKAGANPRAKDKDGKTPHAIARKGNKEILWKAMMEAPLK
jgi:ankyrin repeat protein